MIFRCKDVLSLQVIGLVGNSSITIMQRVIHASFTCILAIGGAIVGTIIGAAQGQTAEIGLLAGAAIGAVSGVIAVVHLLEFYQQEAMSKVALVNSLLNGKVFTEWVVPAVLKACQWQISLLESAHRETANIHDVGGVQGIPWNRIQELPVCENAWPQESCCPIRLQQFKDRQSARKLPRCGHLFHVNCVDKWLNQQGTCPMCRLCVCI